MNEQGKLDLNTVLERTQLTLGDILGSAYSLCKKDQSLANAKILFSFDLKSGNLECCVWKSDTEIYSLFSNGSTDSRHKDFQVLVRMPISEEDRKVISKVAEGMKPNTVKRVNLDKIREEVRAEAEQK